MNEYVIAHFIVSRSISFIALADRSSALLALAYAFRQIHGDRFEFTICHGLIGVELESTHVRACPSHGEPNAITISQYFRCSRPIQ